MVRREAGHRSANLVGIEPFQAFKCIVSKVRDQSDQIVWANFAPGRVLSQDSCLHSPQKKFYADAHAML